MPQEEKELTLEEGLAVFMLQALAYYQDALGMPIVEDDERILKTFAASYGKQLIEVLDKNGYAIVAKPDETG